MRRREFITLLGGAAAAAWPLAARAQQPATPVIGLLGSGSAEAYAQLVGAFRRGLNESGFFEGQNVTLEYRWAQDQYDRLPALAAELISRQVAVLFAINDPSAKVVKALTATIPVLFISSDPVKLGLVASLNRPGSNITGVSILSATLEAKRLEFLLELVPKAETVAVLVNPNNPPAEGQLTDAQAAARTLRRQIQVLRASSEREIDLAFSALVQSRVGALLVGSDPFFNQRYEKARISRRWRSYELRNEPKRCLSAGRYLCRPHPEGRQAGRSASPAVGESRAGHQPQDSESARSHRPSHIAWPRRRGDRVKRREFITLLGGAAAAWPLAARAAVEVAAGSVKIGQRTIWFSSAPQLPVPPASGATMTSTCSAMASWLGAS